jgi:hypothetical protein
LLNSPDKHQKSIKNKPAARVVLPEKHRAWPFFLACMSMTDVIAATLPVPGLPT